MREALAMMRRAIEYAPPQPGPICKEVCDHRDKAGMRQRQSVAFKRNLPAHARDKSGERRKLVGIEAGAAPQIASSHGPIDAKARAVKVSDEP